MAHALCMLDNWGYRHTLRIPYTSCFPTTKCLCEGASVFLLLSLLRNVRDIFAYFTVYVNSVFAQSRAAISVSLKAKEHSKYSNWSHEFNIFRVEVYITWSAWHVSDERYCRLIADYFGPVLHYTRHSKQTKHTSIVYWRMCLVNVDPELSMTKCVLL